MNVWGYFAAITVVTTCLIVATAVRDRRARERSERRDALQTGFTEAVGLPGETISTLAVDAMEKRGWTVDDMPVLGRSLSAGLNGRGTGTGTGGRDVYTAACVARATFAALGRDQQLLRGSTVRDQMTWIVLLSVHDGTDVLSPIEGSQCQARRAIGAEAYINGPGSINAWHQTLGPLAPYAVAAGLSLDEATHTIERGSADLSVLVMLAALRGVVLPAPHLPASTGGPP